MRRKSARETKNTTPEKSKAEPQRRSRRQSNRRRRRSSSRSSEDSNGPDPTAQDLSQNSAANIEGDSELTNIVESVINHDKEVSEIRIDIQSSETTHSIPDEEHSSMLSKEDNKDTEEGKEETEDVEEKKNKGKSKGKNKSNIEQSSNNIEPETENENVQGTPQSPSNDYADNENVVQNVNDTTNVNDEQQGDGKVEDTITPDSEEQKGLDTSFVSEYAQDNEASQEQKSNFSDNDERSTTPAPKIVMDTIVNVPEGNLVETQIIKICNEEIDNNERETSCTKKKITLRRSTPINREGEKDANINNSALPVNRSNSTEENKKTMEKSSKKITLKRYTTEDGSSTSVEIKNERVSRSLSEDVGEKKRRVSIVSDESKEQNKEGNILSYF